jgi:ABC-2 type transport system ATP-binding protein
VLSLQNLRKRFGARVAVDDLSLEIKSGEVFGLLGPNGAGKTTTVGMAVGLLRPDSGRVDVAGCGSPERPEVRAKIGVAPQSLAIYEELTGEENVSFFGALAGLRGARLAERVDFALSLVQLSDRRHERAKTYSSGMKRRLNVAGAIVHDPEVLLLDEPTVGVDPQSRNALFDNVRAMRASGRTVVFTTHYMEEAERLCDRVAILDEGRVLALGTVPELVAAHGGRTALVVETASGEERIETDDPVAALGRVAAETEVLSFKVDRADLERVFLRLTGKKLRD